MKPEERDLVRIGRLKVLCVWADPAAAGWSKVPGIEAETDSIRRALSKLRANHVEIKEVPNASVESLEEGIQSFKPHVFYFMGHGAFPSVDFVDFVGPFSACR